MGQSSRTQTEVGDLCEHATEEGELSRVMRCNFTVQGATGLHTCTFLHCSAFIHMHVYAVARGMVWQGLEFLGTSVGTKDIITDLFLVSVAESSYRESSYRIT